MGDPERIWLQNAKDAEHTLEGRLWCQDKVWPNDPEDGEPTEYVRADLLSTARAEARREALEEAVKIFDKQRPEWVTKKQGEYWDGYRDAIEDAIDEIRGVSTITKHRRAAALSELAAQDAELIEEPDPDLLRDDAHERRRMMKEFPDEE